MRISALTYLFHRMALDEVFSLFNHYGLDGIEVWGGRPHGYVDDMDESAVRNILRLSQNFKLPVSMFVPEILAYPFHPCSRLESERKDAKNYLMRCVRLTSALECERMQVTIPHPGYSRDKHEVWQQLIDVIGSLAAEAERQGVRIVVESLSPSEGGNLLANADDLARLFAEVKSDYLVGMIDVVPPFIAQEPYSECFRKWPGKMDYVHISNSDGQTEWHAAINEPNGVLPIKSFLMVLKRLGYDGWVSLELLNPYFGDPELHLAASFEALSTYLNELES